MKQQMAIAAMAQRLHDSREKAAIYANMGLPDMAQRHAHHAGIQVSALVRLSCTGKVAA